MGGLEHDVMEFLWTTEAAATPGEVHAAVAPDLAYTTIMTVLTRLWQKQMLTRERQGRAYVYEPARSEAVHRADAMQSTLDNAADKAAVLSSFVETLDGDDAKTLKKLLSGRS